MNGRCTECRLFDAAAVTVEDGGRVTLSAVAFYATGGGPPHDTDTLARRAG